MAKVHKTKPVLKVCEYENSEAYISFKEDVEFIGLKNCSIRFEFENE